MPFTYAPLFDNDFRWINVSEHTALEVHNRVRAFPGLRDIPLGALANIDGKSIHMKQTICRERETIDNDSNVVVATRGSIPLRSKDDIELEVIDWGNINMKQTIYRKREIAMANDSNGVVATPESITLRSESGSSLFIQCKDVELEVIKWGYYYDGKIGKNVATNPAA